MTVWLPKGAFGGAYSGIGIAGMIRMILPFRARVDYRHVGTIKGLQSLWNQSSPRMNNCLAYSNYSYSGIGPKERALNLIEDSTDAYVELQNLPEYIAPC